MTQARESIDRLPSVMKRVELSRSSIYLKMKNDTFPQPIKLGVRAIGWPSSAIDEWIEDQIKAAA